jgi:hypothetical protein
MLALGVVWAPKLLMVHGISQSVASFGSSMLWLGLAAGSAVVPWWSDVIKARKMPIILGGAVQLVCLLLLVYVPNLGTAIAIILCFIFGFANAAHMLAFSTAADVVRPSQIGTSAAIVNGIMFIVGRCAHRDGVRGRDRTEVARTGSICEPAPAHCARHRYRAVVLHEGDLPQNMTPARRATTLRI